MVWCPSLDAAGKTVPAVYVLGDSLADVGNNNHLLTIMKADFPHNGIDFTGGKATGRFSNGKNSADFIAEKLGLTSPPAYLSINSSFYASQALAGINFASAGAGILDATHSGECLSLNKQIDYLSTAYASMVESIGNEQAQAHLADSIFAVIIGSNDIFGYVKSNGNATPQQFVGSLIYTLQVNSLRLLNQRLYNIGARKFSFAGTGPVGCCPSLRRQTQTNACNAAANSISDLFSQAAASLLQELKSQLTDMNYSFFNTTLAMQEIIQTPTNYGFTEVEAACCGLGDLNAKVACTPISSYCSNRTNHVFWDFYHPTEATAGILAADLFDGSAPHVYPVNLRQLSAL
ncbi:GDSL esterase/lipase At5g55050 [Phalaenopsis equestris]|uniref:GDSL esterase/lipase At5g55050 n=1 Tax=Phalaenopsis equestris TaxID=78828 RepID=UPI0009E38A57|nr:GDSL esterase/lipase At5g55050 [Phalaenopsis equestris]